SPRPIFLGASRPEREETASASHHSSRWAQLSPLEDRLREREQRYEVPPCLLAAPATIADPPPPAWLSRWHALLAEVVEAGRRWRQARDEERDARALWQEAGADAEVAELARGELERLKPEVARLEEQLKRLLAPRDPLDNRDAVVEVRAGTGGD